MSPHSQHVGHRPGARGTRQAKRDLASAKDALSRGQEQSGREGGRAPLWVSPSGVVLVTSGNLIQHDTWSGYRHVEAVLRTSWSSHFLQFQDI